MVAVRPTFHHPALLAKQAANIDRISGGRLALNVVSSWWKDEATQYGVAVRRARRAATRGRRSGSTSSRGCGPSRVLPRRAPLLASTDAILEPKPVARPAADALRRRRVGGGQEPDRARSATPTSCTATRPRRIAAKIADMRERRERSAPESPPPLFGVSGFVVCRDTEEEARREVARITDVRASAPRLRQLRAVARRHEARAAGEPRGLLGLQPRPALGSGRHARTDRRAARRLRATPAST